MTKEEIRGVFEDTRPNLKMDPKRYQEYGYMEYSRSVIETYLRKTLKMPELRIVIKHSLDIVNRQTFSVLWSSEARCLQIFFKSQENARFKERTAIAEALSLIAMDFVRHLTNRKTLSFDVNLPAIHYFAQNMLEFCANGNYGSVLRKKYTCHANDVVNEISNLRSDSSSQSLSDLQRAEIKELFEGTVFSAENRTVADGMLSNDIKLITKYIQDREPLRNGIRNSLAITTQSVNGVNRLVGKLFCHETGCDIQYPAVEDIRAARERKHEVAIDEIAATRIIVAHELGHVVCHRTPGFLGPIGSPTPSTSEVEREATYFARLLLEHREFLYNNTVDDKEYREACAVISELIRRIYYGYGEEWLSWVLND